MIDGVLVTDFACAGALAAVLRANLLELAQARNAAIQKHDTLELLHRYLSGVEFRQRVEAIVEAFTAMRADLDQERRAAERAAGPGAPSRSTPSPSTWPASTATCRDSCRRCRRSGCSNCPRPRRTRPDVIRGATPLGLSTRALATLRRLDGGVREATARPRRSAAGANGGPSRGSNARGARSRSRRAVHARASDWFDSRPRCVTSALTVVGEEAVIRVVVLVELKAIVESREERLE